MQMFITKVNFLKTKNMVLEINITKMEAFLKGILIMEM